MMDFLNVRLPEHCDVHIIKTGIQPHFITVRVRNYQTRKDASMLVAMEMVHTAALPDQLAQNIVDELIAKSNG